MESCPVRTALVEPEDGDAWCFRQCPLGSEGSSSGPPSVSSVRAIQGEEYLKEKEFWITEHLENCVRLMIAAS